ncbi:MAG: guanylate kinase [Chlorobiaceae bacterium]|jgi:guanylate kinase|nr:guanylate kinase [Chlorobiaceae bacterium]
MAGKKIRQGKLIVFSAPSGTGKSTIAKMVLKRLPDVRFSVSATTRKKREGEQEGVNYYFLTHGEFEEKVRCGGFIEHEYFFGNHYGTLLDKTREVIESGASILLDLDVKGAMNLKRIFSDQALLLFIMPPDMEVLEQRLKNRDSENEDELKVRLERARLEMEYADKFDKVIVNDDLEQAVDAVTSIMSEFISKT